MIAAIREIPAETALQWEKSLGVVGILSCRRPDLALGAFDASRLVGAATISGEWISGVVVDPGYRRQGIGHALFLEAFHVLREGGVATVRVQPCSASGRALIECLPKEVGEHLYEKDYE